MNAINFTPGDLRRMANGRCSFCNCDQWVTESIHHADCVFADGTGLDLTGEEITALFAVVESDGAGSHDTDALVMRLIAEVVRRRKKERENP